MTDNEVIILDRSEQINAWMLLSRKAALHLEVLGMRHSRGSVYAYIKREYGFKGNKRRVYDQYCEYLRKLGLLLP